MSPNDNETGSFPLIRCEINELFELPLMSSKDVLFWPRRQMLPLPMSALAALRGTQPGHP